MQVNGGVQRELREELPSTKGGGAIGSATVSKTVGCRFESCPPCHPGRMLRLGDGKDVRVSGTEVEQAGDARAPKGAEKRGFFGRIILFIQQVFSELKKVVTPTKKELINFTVVVIAFVVIMMAFVWVLDQLFSWLAVFVFGGSY